MLTKLIKVELMATRKVILIMWILAATLAIISGISYHVNYLAGMLVYLFSTLLFILIFALQFIVILGNMAIRFYREMLTTEGYLTHMLPVEPWQHIVSRVIATLIWFVLSTLVLFGLIALTVLITGNNDGSFWQSIFDTIARSGYLTAGNVLMVVVYGLTGLVEGILAIYTAILIGGCANRHKGMYALLALIAILIIEGILSLILGLGETVEFMDTTGTLYGSFTIATWKDTIFQILLMLIFFFSSRDLLAKKVNLT